MQDCYDRLIGNLGLPICLGIVSRGHGLGDIIHYAELLPSQRGKENISVSNDILWQAKERIYGIVVDIDELFCCIVKREQKNNCIFEEPIHNSANMII